MVTSSRIKTNKIYDLFIYINLLLKNLIFHFQIFFSFVNFIKKINKYINKIKYMNKINYKKKI